MIATTKNKSPSANIKQLSPLPDVSIRLSEIRRRLKTAWTQCGNETPRNLIANAEHEVCRGILLLEAEVNRTESDRFSAR